MAESIKKISLKQKNDEFFRKDIPILNYPQFILHNMKANKVCVDSRCQNFCKVLCLECIDQVNHTHKSNYMNIEKFKESVEQNNNLENEDEKLIDILENIKLSDLDAAFESLDKDIKKEIVIQKEEPIDYIKIIENIQQKIQNLCKELENLNSSLEVFKKQQATQFDYSFQSLFQNYLNYLGYGKQSQEFNKNSDQTKAQQTQQPSNQNLQQSPSKQQVPVNNNTKNISIPNQINQKVQDQGNNQSTQIRQDQSQAQQINQNQQDSNNKQQQMNQIQANIQDKQLMGEKEKQDQQYFPFLIQQCLVNYGKGITKIKFYLNGLSEVKKRGQNNLRKIEQSFNEIIYKVEKIKEQKLDYFLQNEVLKIEGQTQEINIHLYQQYYNKKKQFLNLPQIKLLKSRWGNSDKIEIYKENNDVKSDNKTEKQFFIGKNISQKLYSEQTFSKGLHYFAFQIQEIQKQKFPGNLTIGLIQDSFKDSNNINQLNPFIDLFSPTLNGMLIKIPDNGQNIQIKENGIFKFIGQFQENYFTLQIFLDFFNNQFVILHPNSQIYYFLDQNKINNLSQNKWRVQITFNKSSYGIYPL